MKAYKKLIYISFASLCLLFSCSEEVKEPPPAEVGTIVPEQKSVPVVKEYVGEIKGKFDIPIRARVDGFLEELAFLEGSEIEKGQLLYVIDDQPFLAELANAKSQLAAAKTELVRATNELNRIRPLAEINAVSKSDLDAAIATEGAAEATVDAARANIELAEIKLSYSKIYSPIKGTIGKSEAYQGEYVGKSPNPVILNTVSRTDTIQLRFFLSENEYLTLARYSVKMKSDADFVEHEDDDENSKVELVMSDGSIHPFEGDFDFIDRNVNASTGSILVQASFPNPNKVVRPGQYGRLRYTFTTRSNSIIVPQKCVMETQGQFSVYILTEENKVESRVVTIFGTYNDYYIISDGLQGKEKIVLEGLQKVRPGAEVDPYEAEFKSRVPEKK